MNPTLHWAHETWPTLYMQVVEQSQHALQKWRCVIRDACTNGDWKPISKWLKLRGELPLLQEGERIETHPHRVGQSLAAAWGQIYTPQDLTGMDEITLDNKTKDLPHIPWNPPSLTCADFAKAVKMRPTSSPGIDEVQFELLKALPVHAWQGIVEIFQDIEAGAPWPRDWLRVLLVPIPKSAQHGLLAADKFRLISISSALHRTWSSARAIQMSVDWLPRVINQATFGGVKQRSVQLAAAMDSSLWDAAWQAQVPLYSIYLDSSKCFDTIKFNDILGVASRLGLGPRLLAPLTSWYFNHERVLSIKDWLQPPLRPGRGLPQGCPLSVSLSILWSLTWSSKILQRMQQEEVRFAHCLTYLDDFTMAASSQTLLQECVGLTSWHFKAWGIQLNMQKTAVLANNWASQQTTLFDCQVLDSQRLLGITTGWDPAQTVMKERLAVAQLTRDRLARLPVPLQAMERLMSIFVTPLAFGSEFHIAMPDLLSFDKKLRPILWGHARVSSNWHLIRAFGFSSHRATMEGQRHLELFRGIWNCGAHERLRSRLLTSWNSFLLPRSSGLWNSWLQQLATFGARLLQDGGVEAPWFPHWKAHINQSKQSWMHCARALWKAHWARMGIRHLFPEASDSAPHVDWDCVKAMTKTRSTMAATILTNGLNTRTRSSLHFRDDCEAVCEHGCGVPDTFRHRSLDCPGCQPAREAAGLDLDDYDALADPHRFLLDVSLPLHPKPCQDALCDLQDAWGLWPQANWLARLMEAADLGETIVGRVQYSSSEAGQHPQLQQHGIQVEWSLLTLGSQRAAATTSAYTREDWEAEILILASLISLFIRAKVELRGLGTNPDTLWKKIQAKQAPLAFLSETALTQKEQVDFAPACSDNNLVFEPFVQMTEDAIQTWNHHWRLQARLITFMTEMPACFPIAAQLSRTHGRQPQPEHNWLRGGFSLLSCASTESVPLNRNASPSLVFWIVQPRSGFGVQETLCLGSESFAFESEVTLSFLPVPLGRGLPSPTLLLTRPLAFRLVQLACYTVWCWASACL